MSKDDGNFTKNLVESNEIFAEAIRLLQDQIKKVTTRLETLEKDLKSARSQLKTKDTEILRLREILHTYESDQKKFSSKTDQNVVDLLLPQIKDLTETIRSLQSKLQNGNSSDLSLRNENESYEYQEVEVDDEEFNSLVEELEGKKLEIQSLQQEKIDLIEQGNLLQSKINVLEQNLEKLSESKISMAFNELRDRYEKLEILNSTLDNKIKELESTNAKIVESSSKDEENHISSLKDEISKYVKDNISLQEKLDSNATLESKVSKQQEENTQLKNLLSEMENKYQDAASNLEQNQNKLIRLQEENQSLETKVTQLTHDNLFQKNEISSLTNQLNQKEEEMLDLKLKADQLAEKFDDSLFSDNQLETSDDEDETDQDELLLRISEMELEEANWQDEKKVLLQTIENLRFTSTKSPDQKRLEETIQRNETQIKNLKNEILELNQDMDDADAELKEIELENNVLREKIADLEEKGQVEPVIPTMAPQAITQIKEENTKLVYELKEKDTKLEESLTRLKSQEQKISHIESLMDQERQLREKYEFLYSGLKDKLVKKEQKRETDNVNAQKQLEQVIKSLNLSEELTNLTEEDNLNENNESDDSLRKSSAADDLKRAMESTGLYLSLIDKFLKPHVQITQLLKQGDWEINSLAEIVGLNNKELKIILNELADKKIIKFDENKVWLLLENESND